MQVYLKAVIGPRTELEDTGLLVEWEVLHVDLAGWLINGRGLPLDQSLMVDGGLRGQGHLEVAVRAASEHISGSGRCGGRAYFVLPIRYQAVFFFLLIFLYFFLSLLFLVFSFLYFFFVFFFFLFCFILACALTLPWRRRKQVLAIRCTFRARETANATISYAWPAREIRRARHVPESVRRTNNKRALWTPLIDPSPKAKYLSIAEFPRVYFFRRIDRREHRVFLTF